MAIEYVVISSLSGVTAILVLQQIFRHFGSGYLKKKGENLATKEDIDVITHQIELIKSSFDVKTEIRKSFSQEQKTELLRFYDVSTEFRYEYLSVNFGNFPQDDGQSLYKYQQQFHAKVTEILKSYQRLVVYLQSSNKMLCYAEKMANLSLEADKVMKRKFYQIKKTSINESIAYAATMKDASKDSYHQAVDEANKANKDFWSEMKPVANEYIELYQKYLTELNAYLTPETQI